MHEACPRCHYAYMDVEASAEATPWMGLCISCRNTPAPPPVCPLEAVVDRQTGSTGLLLPLLRAREVGGRGPSLPAVNCSSCGAPTPLREAMSGADRCLSLAPPTGGREARHYVCFTCAQLHTFGGPYAMPESWPHPEFAPRDRRNQAVNCPACVLRQDAQDCPHCLEECMLCVEPWLLDTHPVTPSPPTAPPTAPRAVRRYNIIHGGRHNVTQPPPPSSPSRPSESGPNASPPPRIPTRELVERMGQGTRISVGDDGLVGYVDPLTPPPRGHTAVPQQTPTPRRLAVAATSPHRWPAGPRSSSEIRVEGDDSRFAVSFTDEAVSNGLEGRTEPGRAQDGHRACRHVRARLSRGQPDPLDPLAQAGAEAADREARYAALWLAIELRWGGGDTDTWSPPLNPASGGGVDCGGQRSQRLRP